MKKYYELKKEHEVKVNNFPMAFAFSAKQLEEAKEKLGVKDNSELYKIGAGGLIRKTDSEALDNLFTELNNEVKDYLKQPEQFKDAIIYELANHEFCITYDYEPALDALGLSYNRLTEEQLVILNEAKNQYLHEATA